MRVQELWRYPVKSLRGERLECVEVGPRGLEGDRLTRVLGSDGSKLTARTARRLLELQGGIEDDEPTVDGHRWDSELAVRAIAGAAGEDATLAPLDRHFDSAPTLVVTDGAVAALGEDRRRLRPNVLVEGVEGLAERDWVGRRLRLGAVELLVRERCERCLVTTIDPDTLEVRPGVLSQINSEFEGTMGVYCEVTLPGAIAIGDAVELR